MISNHSTTQQQNGGAEKRRISEEELRYHLTPKRGLWLAIRNKVYDITEWSQKHPGGADVLRVSAGKDVTTLFESYHADQVAQILPKFYVGELESKTIPTFPPKSEFYSSLQNAINEYFAKNNINPRFSPTMLLISIALILLNFSGHFLALWCWSRDDSFLFYLGCLSCVISGWTISMLSIYTVHEASHTSCTNSPLVWRIMGAVHDFVTGTSFYTWLHQHFVGHHQYCNILDGDVSLDPDTVTKNPDIRRIKYHQEMMGYYRWQHIYAPMLYGLLGIKYRVNDIVTILWKRKSGDAVVINPMSRWHFICFWGGKLFWFSYRIIFPLFYFGWASTLACFLISDLVASYYLAIIFQVNHVIPEAKWHHVDENGRVSTDWAKLQISSSLDYGHDSPLTTFLTGALNYQVVHHLFPYVSQFYLPKIAPIVRAHCKAHGVKYNYLPDFSTAFLNHINYLRMMGEGKLS